MKRYEGRSDLKVPSKTLSESDLALIAASASRNRTTDSVAFGFMVVMVAAPVYASRTSGREV